MSLWDTACGEINIFAIVCAAVAARGLRGLVGRVRTDVARRWRAGVRRGCAGERRPEEPRQGLKPGRDAMLWGIHRGAEMARQEGVDGFAAEGEG